MLAVDGGQLWYEIAAAGGSGGLGTGPTIVLIHGGLVDSRMWDDQVRGLSRSYGVALWLDHHFFASGKSRPGFEERIRSMLEDNFRYWEPTAEPIVVTWPEPPAIERVPAIWAPTLIVDGDRDAPHILAIGEVLERKIPGAERVVMTGVGHHLNMEEPERFDAIVVDFLRRQGLP